MSPDTNSRKGTRSDKVRFTGATGETLAARLERPAHEPRDFVLFAHCFTCSKDLKAVGRISDALVERGFGVFRFDFTGLGESEGDFADTNFTSNVEDLVAAADWLRDNHRAPRVLVGHSLGGAATVVAAARVPESRAIATIGAPSSTDHLSEVILDAAPELAEADDAQVKLAGRCFRLKRQFVEDLQVKRVIEAAGQLDRALLILHSPVDETVAIDHARRLYDAAKHPKSFVSLDDADHLLLRDPQDARYAADVLAAWAGRYLDEDDRQAARRADADKGEVVVRNGPPGYTCDIATEHHVLTGDEPHPIGDDLGPNPYEFLLTSLGTCTAMTLRMYAKRKKWPLESVEVRLVHDRIHAEDCEDCETKEGQVDRIRKVIAIEGDLDDQQRARLLEIGDRCPVHRTLKNEIKIESRQATETAGS